MVLLFFVKELNADVIKDFSVSLILISLSDENILSKEGNKRNVTNNNLSFNYLDSPSSTSAITYKLQVNPNPGASTGRTFELNRPSNLGDNTRIWTVSTITVMEISG